MDVFLAASPVVTAVNPITSAQLHKSTGYTTGATGKQVPTYAAAVTGNIQVQGMSAQLLQHMNNLNINGVLRKVYMLGDWESIVRSTMRGGDVFVFSHGDITSGTWLVVHVLETWETWCSVIVQLQTKPLV